MDPHLCLGQMPWKWRKDCGFYPEAQRWQQPAEGDITWHRKMIGAIQSKCGRSLPTRLSRGEGDKEPRLKTQEGLHLHTRRAWVILSVQPTNSEPRAGGLEDMEFNMEQKYFSSIVENTAYKTCIYERNKFKALPWVVKCQKTNFPLPQLKESHQPPPAPLFLQAGSSTAKGKWRGRWDDIMSVSGGCYKDHPKLGGLRIAEMYLLTVLEARIAKSAPQG